MSIQSTDNKVSFIRTTTDKWGKQASKDNNAIVFLEDTKQIWNNGKYYNTRECYTSDFVSTTGDEYYQIQGVSSGDYFIWRDEYRMYDQLGILFSFIPNTLYEVIGPNENGEVVCTYKPVWFYDSVIIYNNGNSSVLDDIECGENEIPSDLISKYNGNIFDQYGNEYIYKNEKFYPKFNKSQFSKNNSGQIGITVSNNHPKGSLLTSLSGNIGTQPLTVDSSTSGELGISSELMLKITGKGTTELIIDSDGVKSDDFYDEYGNIRDTVRSKYSFEAVNIENTNQILIESTIGSLSLKRLNYGDIVSIVFPSKNDFTQDVLNSYLHTNGPLVVIDQLGGCELYYNQSMRIRQALVEIENSINSSANICFFQPDTPYLFYYADGNKLIWIHQQGAGAQNFYIQNTYENVDGSVVTITPKINSGTLIAEYTINEDTNQIYQKNNTFELCNTNIGHPIIFKNITDSDSQKFLYNSILNFNPVQNKITFNGVDITSSDTFNIMCSYGINLGTDTNNCITIVDNTITGNLQGNATNATTATTANYVNVENSVKDSGSMRIAFIDEKTGKIHSCSNGWISYDNNADNLLINASAKKIQKPFKVQVNSTDKITFDGSSQKILNLKTGNNIQLTGDTNGNVTNVTISGTKNGTVTSIVPGTGLTGTSSDNAITTSGTINLKTASTNEIGGIKISNKSTENTGTNYPVWLDENSVAYTTVPNNTVIGQFQSDYEYNLLGYRNNENEIRYTNSLKLIDTNNISKFKHDNQIVFGVGNTTSSVIFTNNNNDKFNDLNLEIINSNYSTCMFANTTMIGLEDNNSGEHIRIGKIYPSKIYNNNVKTQISIDKDSKYFTRLSYDYISIYNGYNNNQSQITDSTISTNQFISTQPSPETITDVNNRKGNIKCPNNSSTKANPIFTVETGDGKVYGFFINEDTPIDEVGKTGYCDIVLLKK